MRGSKAELSLPLHSTFPLPLRSCTPRREVVESAQLHGRSVEETKGDARNSCGLFHRLLSQCPLELPGRRHNIIVTTVIIQDSPPPPFLAKAMQKLQRLPIYYRATAKREGRDRRTDSATKQVNDSLAPLRSQFPYMWGRETAACRDDSGCGQTG